MFENAACFKGGIDNWSYYLPRLAVLTGCRLNELARLRVEDINLQGAPYSSINDNTVDKAVKNESSVRKVLLPVDAVTPMTALLTGKTKEQRVFPEFLCNNANGYAPKPSKYFSDLYRNKLGLNGASFHSFRHFATTHLFNSEVKEGLIGSLVGHSVGKMTTDKVYLSGFNDRLKLEVINHLGATYPALDE
ncbi:tyrosine-type recombinase/integrase [Vibrio coralliirubri]|uniref:tyrosine-type recombinase/integrase n=1 Tax=Vibrio coralliirubri TaxID=1516159 RepID=UPI0013C53489|nr:tyrosine-type recombinase/integrase [Vibrio coralliirubri]